MSVMPFWGFGSLLIVIVIKYYLMSYLCGTPSRHYIHGSCCKHYFATVPMASPMGYCLNISCYDDAIFNFCNFIEVPIGKTCSMSLMRFSNRIFYILFFSQCFKVLMFAIETVFNSIVIKPHPSFYALKMALGRRPKYQ